MGRVYCCIDLKSFFASVECVERGLDPFKENLVVADPDRGSGTICLAVSPAMKAAGVKNRCRVFEIPKNVCYITAKPRMKLYMEKSLQIYSVYLKFISPDDILVYSIDECFIDLTDYVKLYGKTETELARLLVDAVYKETGIRAAAGVGTNMFLAKVALDITAKHSADFMGYLDEEEFKKTIWRHRPITDVWNVGPGIAERLKRYGIYDLYGVAHCPEETLYREFGVNAELLIDHSKGIEPCTIKDAHAYKSKTASLSNGQVLFSDYSKKDALVIIKEMAEGLIYEIIDKELVTNSVSLSLGFADRTLAPRGGTTKLPVYTDSYKKIFPYFEKLFNKFAGETDKIRRVNVGLNNLIHKDYVVYDLFADKEKDDKENALQKAIIGVKKKYGKNALLRGVSFEEKATARERNGMIGGHNGGET